jgi:hypothetical protein
VRPILRHLEQRAEHLNLTFLESEHDEVVADLACFITTLAMNYVQRKAFMD